MPEVSIITPCYNDAATLGEAIASVAAQQFSDWEHIIIDDGSSDGSGDLIAAARARDPRIKPVRFERNQGAAHARNAGIRQSTGRYIAFLDADDLWAPEKLARQLTFMKENDFAFSFTSYSWVSANGRKLSQYDAPARVDRSALLRRNWIGCLTAIYDTEFFGRVEMPDIRQRQDWALWLRLLRSTPYAYGLNEVLATHRRREGSLSANKARAARHTWQMYREVEALSWPRAAWYFSLWTASHLKDKWRLR